MFGAGFIKRIKSNLFNFSCMFGSFILPLSLAILFSITIPNAGYQNYQTIPVSIIGRNRESTMLYMAMEKAKTNDAKKMFKVSLCTNVMAEDKLVSGDIVAYIDVVKGYHITAINKEGKVGVIKSYIDWYKLTGGEEILNMNMQYAIDKCAERDFNRNEIYFINLLALASISSLYWGVRVVVETEKMSPVGMRIRVSPASKNKVMLQNVLATFIISFLCNIILVGVVERLTNMDLFAYIGQIILIMTVTSVIGMEAGVYIGLWKESNYAFQYRLCSVILVISGFLAGIFRYKVRYIVDNKFPFFGAINPVSVTADALYCLYFTHDTEQYYWELLRLACIMVVLGIGIVFIKRRKKHASI